MKRHTVAGFTIIETMLFLAISGALAVGLMVGMGAAIGSQQYRDSVQSYANYLRGQYGQAVAVENGNVAHDSDVCSSLGAASTDDRGRSDCVIVGRHVVAVSGDTYDSQPIYAVQNADTTWRYGVGAFDGKYQTSWQADTTLGATARPVDVAMWREPESGRMRTKLNTGVSSLNTPEQVTGFITAAEAGDAGGEICVKSGGILIAGERQSIFIDSRAASSDAIRVGNAVANRCKTW